jgi:hypothetical protein
MGMSMMDMKHWYVRRHSKKKKEEKSKMTTSKIVNQFS